ncbi:MAG: dTDP-4-dehydrorhamnose 3,5-epimerase family protein [Planctomycetes bacterium]|nr:dTDP-4-dehydrorhamnose 3,5-epimerase family protein [Planctomycetota bacterium]
MKITEIEALKIEDVKIVRFVRFCDHRGYFTEHFRRSDFANHAELGFMKGVEFVQCNESCSKKGVIRGLHFQWNPYMGKLVRTLAGRMVDVVLDIRKGSDTFGKAICYDMPTDPTVDYHEWIWVPPGFAHGNFFTEDGKIEYFCSGEYSPGCEAGISPLAADIDWSLCDAGLKKEFDDIVFSTELITEKDRDGFTMQGWLGDERSDNFVDGKL